MIIDWTFGLLFRPDIVKIDLDSETALLLRDLEPHESASERPVEGESRTGSATRGGAEDRVPIETTFLTAS
jgi:hypothetical protein